MSILASQKIFATPRGGPVRLFGLPWGFTPNRCLSPQKKISDQAHPLHRKNRTSKSRKIDFFGKNFRKILTCQKFLCSKCCRNFCSEGRTTQDHNFSGFQSWNNPSKTRKVTIIQSYEAFGQKPHFWTTWWLLTLIALFARNSHRGKGSLLSSGKGTHWGKKWNLEFPFFSLTSKNSEIKISLPWYASQSPPKNIFTFFVRRTFTRCC